MFIAFFKKLAGASLIALGCFVLGYWLWPSGVFEIPLGELTLDKIAWGALSLCFWVGGLRYLGNEFPGLEKQLSEIEATEKIADKIVIDCPYCAHRMRIPLGRRLQVKCPNSDCKKEFKYGNADGDVKRGFAQSYGSILSAVLLVFGLIWIVDIATESRAPGGGDIEKAVNDYVYRTMSNQLCFKAANVKRVNGVDHNNGRYDVSVKWDMVALKEVNIVEFNVHCWPRRRDGVEGLERLMLGAGDEILLACGFQTYQVGGVCTLDKTFVFKKTENGWQ
jgi:hypothetical protein